MKYSASLSLAAVLLFAPAVLTACSCIDNGCGIDQGDAVLLGTVVSKQVADNHNADGTMFSPVPSIVRFSVQEAFRGVQGSEVDVATTEGCCACGYPFEIGHSYLVFASRYGGELTTGTCTLTQPAVTAAALLQQLRKIKAGQSPASVFGTVLKYPQDARIEGRENAAPLGDVPVTIVGVNGKEFNTKSDAAGAYQFQALPAGNYEIHPLLPEALTTHEQIDKKPAEVSVTPSTSCRRDIFVFSDGRITGRVEDAQGRPLPSFVTIEPADPDKRREAAHNGGLPGSEPQSDAHFRLLPLPPGRYFLRANPDTGAGVDFRVICYYPQTIELAEGQHLDDIVLVCTK